MNKISFPKRILSLPNLTPSYFYLLVWHKLLGSVNKQLTWGMLYTPAFEAQTWQIHSIDKITKYSSQKYDTVQYKPIILNTCIRPLLQMIWMQSAHYIFSLGGQQFITIKLYSIQSQVTVQYSIYCKLCTYSIFPGIEQRWQ